MKHVFFLFFAVLLFVTHKTSAVTVSGTNIVCTGLTTTFTADAGGGTWSSATPAVATVDETTGVITGVSSGTSVISYNLLGVAYTRTVTVQLQPGAISGPSAVCEGSTIALSNATAGTWASSNTAVGTVSTSGTTTNINFRGVAVAGGTATITFRPTGLTCFTTHEVTVNPRPTAITGLASNLCVTETTLLGSTPAGGTWSSALPTTASVDPVSGLLTAVIYNSAGLSATTVNYTLPTGCTRLEVVRIDQVPSAISGLTNLCLGGTSTLTSSTAGKTWSSSNTGVATITSGGAVSAVAAGTTTISYTNEYGCAAVAVVTVNAVFTPNTGTATICQGLTSALSNATSGGTWSSSNLAVGTVNSTTGLVRGLTVGTTNITYRISTSGCSSITEVTVVATPAAIGGTASACVNNSSTLTHAASGGVWSSSNTAKGTVNSTSGQVTGVSGGTTTISYTVFDGCFVTRTFTVNALPVVNAITGTALVCVSSTTNLANTTPSGVWTSSATGVATVGTTGVVTGQSAGNSTISYTVTNVNGCVNRATREVTVNAIPVVNAITGTTNFCQGTTTLLSSTTPSGVWSSSTIGVATVGTSGLVNGVTAGTSTISYTVTDVNGCIARVTTIVTVNAFPIVPAITGTRTLCANTTTTLANTTSGGVWSSSDLAIATVGTGGVVTGVSNGTSTISYVVSNIAGCTTTVSAVVTVNVVPAVNAITGTMSACVGTTTTLSNTTGSGAWSSSNAAVGTVNSTTGIVTGISAGTTIISYSVTNGFGCIGRSTAEVTVNALPVVAAITGTRTVCVNNTTTLSNATASGVWTSAAPATASIDASGVVSGVLAGNATISYTVTDAFGCIGRSTAIVTVNPLPVVAAITGTATVCENATTNLANATSGGVWTSSATGVATVGTSGIVTGVSAGNATISYTVTNGFGCTATTTVQVTVNALPTVAAITGPLSICVGATTTLSNATSGGVWSSLTPSVATVDASGIVSGVAAGNTIIRYRVTNAFGCITDATTTVTVNTLPVVAPITGSLSVCQGLTTNLSSATGGGVWASSSSAVATVGTSGTVNGVTAGNATISYTVSTGVSCTTTVTVALTVNPLPTVAAITGTRLVCVGLTTNLSNITSGGVWSSSATGIATIGTTGIVTGILPGTSTISYTVTNSFGCVASTTAVVTVNANPVITSTSGFYRVCDNATVNLNSSISGGTWSSSSTSIATIGSATGLVAGVSAGNTNISYTVTATGCISSVVFTVNPTPVVTGIQYLCMGNPSLLTGTPTGGTWASSNTGVATVNSSGLVTSVSMGTSNITYTGAGCFTVSQVTVNAAMPSIFGNQSICETNTSLLTNAVSGGTWSSSDATVATVGSSSGLVTGVNTGVVTISYNLNAGCFATVAVTVMTLPVATTGPSTVCVGATAQLVNTSGSWTSSAPSIAIVNGSGLVSGVSVGNATITFYPTGSICYVTKAITVSALPNTIGGLAPLCPGQSVTLTSTPTGGNWSVQNPDVVSIDPSTGLLTAVMVHHTNILVTLVNYTLPSGCATVRVVTVNPQPAPIFGTSLFMCTGETNTFTTGSFGGTWSSTNTSVATIASSGLVTTTGTGTATISYTFANTCASSVEVTVNSFVSAISGQTLICTGQSSLLSNSVSGGTWSTSDISIASVNTLTGLVTGVTGGTANITYIIGSGCTAITTVTVSSNTASIGGTPSTCVGSTTMLNYPVTGGTWSISNPSVATIDSATGLVTGVSMGATTATYTISDGCFSTMNINVYSLPSAITGTPLVCSGAATTLSGTGGVWSSSNTSIATVSASGILNGISSGNATISYTYYPGGCFVTTQATVNASPSAITATSICSGGTYTFTSTPTGGTWTSSNATTLSINSATGEAIAYNVSTTSPAIVSVTYTDANTCSVSAFATINPLPSAFSGGTSNLCSGGVTTYMSSPSGGIWSSDNTSIATAATGGVVTATGAGVATISYTNAYGCTRWSVLTVNGVVSDNTGISIICTGETTTLSNAIPGGTWTSSNSTRASVNYFTGVVSGINAGTANITYRLSASCYSVTTVTVNSSAPSILGTASACVGSSTNLTYATTGGTWASSNSGIATVDISSGVVTGVATGNATITYFITPTCYKTRSITIFAPPAASTGSSEVCVSSSIALSNTGGTWSSADNTIATVSTSGSVTGVNSGIVNINYRNSTSGCIVSKEITVNALPAVMVSAPLCPGTSATLSTTPSGGTWISANPTVASVNVTTGEVLAVTTPSSASLATITYTSPSGCRRTHLVTVNPLPSSIFGNLRICIGGTTLLNSGTTSGTWSSSNPSVATISTTRVVTGISAGNTTISYTNSLGCSRIAVITVNATPEAITGALSLCTGTTTLLSSSSTAGAAGTWSSSFPSRASVGLTTGLVFGASSGTANITYNPGGPIAANCISVSQVTVNATPASITGTANVCPGLTSVLSHPVSSGTWSSSNPSIATVGATSGVVSGVNSGTAVITYTLPNGCFKTISFTVKPSPVAITGSSSFCVGSSVPQYCFSGAGTWSSSNTGVASIGLTSGILTGITEGTATITFRVNATSCYSTKNITIGATDTVIIYHTGIVSAPTVTVGSVLPLTSNVSGGEWSSSNNSIAVVSATGVVYGVNVGSVIISYTASSPCASGLATMLVYVVGGLSRPSDMHTATSATDASFVLYPNPTEGSLYFVADMPGTVTVYSVDGKQVANYEVVSGTTSVTLPNGISHGVYTCRFVSVTGDSKIVRLIYK